MPWDIGFLLQITTPSPALTYRLETIEHGYTGIGGHPLGTQWSISSTVIAGETSNDFIALDPARSTIRHPELVPGEWTRTQGSMSFGLALTSDQSKALRKLIRRGQVVRFLVGANSNRAVDLAPVWLGVVRSLTWSLRGGWVLQCAELVGGLTTRITTDGTVADLFGGLGSTTLTADYTAGGGSLALASSTGFDGPSDTTTRCVLVTPNTGTPFYLLGTLSGTTFTIAQRSIWNTDDADASTGAAVQAVAYVTGHPIAVARKILTSTGRGTNGPDDVLPQRWGLALSADLLDRADTESTRARLASAAYAWDLRVTESTTDALGWLQDWLRPAGLYLAVTQGLLTIRAVLSEALETQGAITVGDTWIIDVEYDTWDPDVPVEWGSWRATYGDVGTTRSPDPEQDPDGYAAWASTYGAAIAGAPALGTATETDDYTSSRPIRDVYEWPVPDLWRADHDSAASPDTQVTTWSTDLRTRLPRWVTRPPERVRLSLAGFSTARATLGDRCQITSNLLTDRFDGTDDFVNGRYGVILGGGPDWFTLTCEWSVGLPAPVDET